MREGGALIRGFSTYVGRVMLNSTVMHFLMNFKPTVCGEANNHSLPKMAISMSHFENALATLSNKGIVPLQAPWIVCTGIVNVRSSI